jgi:hypothetical protein
MEYIFLQLVPIYVLEFHPFSCPTLVSTKNTKVGGAIAHELHHAHKKRGGNIRLCPNTQV